MVLCWFRPFQVIWSATTCGCGRTIGISTIGETGHQGLDLQLSIPRYACQFDALVLVVLWQTNSEAAERGSHSGWGEGLGKPARLNLRYLLILRIPTSLHLTTLLLRALGISVGEAVHVSRGVLLLLHKQCGLTWSRALTAWGVQPLQEQQRSFGQLTAP